MPDTSNPGPFVNGTCNYTNQAPKGYDWSTSNTAKRFQAMRDAIAKQSHSVLFSLCEWGQADVTTWGNATGAALGEPREISLVSFSPGPSQW